MLHGRRLDPSTRVICDGARGSALRGQGSRSRAPLPPCSSSPDRAPGQKRWAPASGHLNATRGGRADATPRQPKGGVGRRRWGAGTGVQGRAKEGDHRDAGVFLRASPWSSVQRTAQHRD